MRTLSTRPVHSKENTVSRLTNMILYEFTVKRISRNCLFLFGSLLIFCAEAMIINRSYAELSTPPPVSPTMIAAAGATPLQIPIPIWFELGKADNSPTERQFFIEVTQLLLILSGLGGGIIGTLFRPKPQILLLAAAIGSCALSSLFMVSFPSSDQTLLIAGCSCFCCTTISAALPYSLLHRYLLRY